MSCRISEIAQRIVCTQADHLDAGLGRSDAVVFNRDDNKLHAGTRIIGLHCGLSVGKGKQKDIGRKTSSDSADDSWPDRRSPQYWTASIKCRDFKS